MIENIEEASVSTFVTGETRASAPALQVFHLWKFHPLFVVFSISNIFS